MQHVLNLMLGSNAHSGRDMITQKGEPLTKVDDNNLAQIQKVINQPGMMMNIMNYLTHGTAP